MSFPQEDDVLGGGAACAERSHCFYVPASFRASWGRTPTRLRAAGRIKKREPRTQPWAMLVGKRRKYRWQEQNVV